MTSWQCALADSKSRIRHLLKSCEFSDCEFLVGKEKKSCRAHTLILSAASPVFSTMFHGEKWKNDIIEIPDVEPKIFAGFLSFIYSDDFILQSFEEVSGLIYLADKYNIPSLVSKSVLKMKTIINIHNVFEAYEIAKLFDSQDLLQFCKQKILNDIESVIQTEGFNNIKKETLIMILKEDQLKIASEYNLYRAVSKWITADISRRGNAELLKNKGQYAEILENICFATMTPAQFASGPALDGYISKEDSLAILIYLLSPETDTRTFHYPAIFIKGNWNKSRNHMFIGR